jgi:hypothetical protein
MSALLLQQKALPAQPSREAQASPYTATGRFPLAEWLPAAALPSTAQLLTEGGDARIVCGSDGVNRYGCSAVPEPEVLAYGSSTASTISSSGFAAADALRKRLGRAAHIEVPRVTYQRELDRMRRELTMLCGLDTQPGLEIIFGASGTDLHLFASQLIVKTDAPAPLIVRVESAETGRGVPDALAGHHFSDCAALGDRVIPNVPLDCGRPIEIREIRCRAAEGNLRPIDEVDREIEAAVARAATAGQRVLITLVDVSKTGFIAPSPACAVALKTRFPDLVDVLVDACQFRLAMATLKAYVEQGFMVAITGSKFITGPTFCGALLVPGCVSRRMSKQSLPAALKAYSARADWPKGWTARSGLNNVPNFGLLLRWEAALAELRAFLELPEAAVSEFIQSFGAAVTMRLRDDPAFEFQHCPNLNRSGMVSAKNWDQLPTIFSFLLRRKKGWFNQKETKRVHELLREDQRGDHSQDPLLALRCQVGQPVEFGCREGVAVSALRLCLSSRLIVDALAPSGRGARAVIADALAVLDKTALVAASLT